MSTYSELVTGNANCKSFFKLGETEGHFKDSKGTVESTSEGTGLERGVTSLLKNETKDKALKYKGEGTSVNKFGNNYQFSGTSSFTIEFWYQPLTTEGIGDIIGYAKGNGELYEEGYLIYRTTTGLGVIRKGTFKTDVSGVFEKEKTYHIGVTYDGTNIRVFINGVEKGTAKASSGSISLVGEFLMGDTENGAVGSCKHVLDQVAVYNAALTGTVLKEHYEKGIAEEEAGTTYQGSGTVKGEGKVTAAGTRVFLGEGKVSGLGTLSAAGAVAKATSGTVLGTGTITGKGLYTGIGSGTVKGLGTLSAAGVRTTFGAGTVLGVGILTAAASYAYSEAVLATSGLQSYWPLSETESHFKDIKGSVNSTAETSIGYSKAGLLKTASSTKAIELNENSDSIVFSDVYDFEAKQAFSIEFWFKPSALTGRIISKPRETGAHGGWQIDFLEEKLRFARFNEVFAAENWVTSESKLETGQTYHVVAAYSGTALQLFINGKQVGTQLVSLSLQGSTKSVTIGNTEATNGFKGVIDEVAIYNTNLSLTQASEHYSIGAFWSSKGTVLGTGSLTGKGALVRTGSGTVKGVGTLSAAGVLTAIGKGTVIGTGTLKGGGIALLALPVASETDSGQTIFVYKNVFLPIAPENDDARELRRPGEPEGSQEIRYLSKRERIRNA